MIICYRREKAESLSGLAVDLFSRIAHKLGHMAAVLTMTGKPDKFIKNTDKRRVPLFCVIGRNTFATPNLHFSPGTEVI